MRESEITKFLVSITGQIEHIRFPGGVFDDEVYVQYEVVWGPDWEIVSGLSSGMSQMARSSRTDPELVALNMPIELVFSSTNISGWPQIVVTVRANNSITGDSLRGYALFLCPTTCGARPCSTQIFRPRSPTLLGEWVSWLTGKYPELIDPKMLASGKDNYLLRTDAYGTVSATFTMVSKDIRRMGYDNQPPPKIII